MAAADLLTQVEAAITKCLTSQAYTVRGRSQQLAQLDQLRKLRSELMQEINESSANGGSMVSLGEMMDPQ